MPKLLSRRAAVVAATLFASAVPAAWAAGTLTGQAPVVIGHRGARATGPNTRWRATRWPSSKAPTS
jgi:hypothetical protein